MYLRAILALIAVGPPVEAGGCIDDLEELVREVIDIGDRDDLPGLVIWRVAPRPAQRVMSDVGDEGR